MNLQTYISTLISRMRWGSGTAKYGGARDIYISLGYPLEITFKDCWNRYKRQDLSYALISKQIDTTWKDGIEVYDQSTNEETEFDRAWKDVCTSTHLMQKLRTVDTFSMLGRYAILLLGLDDVRGYADWKKEPKAGVDLLYIQPYSEESAEVSILDKNPSSPRYGLPLVYKVTFSDGTSAEVHWKRVIHIIYSDINDGVKGLLYLEKVYNRLLDLDMIVGGDAEMFWRGARPGYTGKIDKEYTLPEGFDDRLKEQIDEFENNLRRILLNEGLDLTALEQQIADPTSHVSVQVDMICAATGIPKRVLIGSERGELASTQDETQFNHLITQRRILHAENNILRPLIDRLMDLEVLPEAEYEVEWQDLFVKSTEQVVSIGKTRSETLSNYVNSVGASSVVPEESFLRLFLGLSDAEVEMLKEEVRKRQEELGNIGEE